MVYQAIHRRGHCNTFQYSQQNIVLWCTLYYVVAGNSQEGRPLQYPQITMLYSCVPGNTGSTAIPYNTRYRILYYGVHCTMLYQAIHVQEGQQQQYPLTKPIILCVLWCIMEHFYDVLCCTTLYEVIPRRGWGQPLHSLSTWCSLVSASIYASITFSWSNRISQNLIFLDISRIAVRATIQISWFWNSRAAQNFVVFIIFVLMCFAWFNFDSFFNSPSICLVVFVFCLV